MFVLYSLSISLYWRRTSNALLMPIFVKSVLCLGLFELFLSKMCCVRFVSSMFVSVVVKTCAV